MTHYLRFPDETTGLEAIASAGFTFTDSTGETQIQTSSHTHALDVIGTIHTGGQWDPETGEVVVPPTQLDGWHVNFVGDLPQGWEDYLVTPPSPARVFLGVN